MKTKGAVVVAAWLLGLLLGGCAGPGRESFDLGMQLSQQGRLEEAIARYEEALRQEPNQPEYKTALVQAQAALEKRRQAAREQKAAPLYAQGRRAQEQKEWVSAVKALREAEAVCPGYRDVPARLRAVETEGLAFFLGEAERKGKTEDWGDVLAALTQAEIIAPKDPRVASGLQEARERHTAAHYLSRAEGFSRQAAWDKAVPYLRKAAAVGTAEEAAARRLRELSIAAATFYLQRAGRDSKRLFPAYSAASLVLPYRDDPRVGTSLDQLLALLYARGEFYEGKGLYGNAFVWFERVNRIHPEYKDVFAKLQNVRERLRERVVKKIAVMDFTSPANSPEAGRIVTDSLLAYLTANATSDVKILARDVLGAILKEIEMGQAGLYDIESAKKAGKLKGTDVFVFGSVLQFHVEKNTAEGTKMSSVAVSKKTVPNPAYQMWLMGMKGAPGSMDMKNAPPATIEEEVRETIRYKVGTEKKRAFVRISYRLIDVEGGEVITTKNLQKVKEVSDDFSEGVSMANIPYDPLQLPADSELLDQVTQEIVADLGKAVLSFFSDPQSLYLKNAEGLRKRRDYEKAVEKLADAIVLEEMKGITGGLTRAADREIESILETVAR